MTLQDVTVTVADGNLGLLPEATDKIVCLLGTSTLGATNTLQVINSSEAVSTGLGYGPLAEAVRILIEESGGPCYAVPLASTAGSNTSVTQSGAGPAVTLTGTPVDNYSAIVQITAAGVIGTSKFKYTLDAGATYSDEIFTASTYLIPNTGVTLNFAAGTYVLNETYSFTSTAPSFDTTQLNAGLDAAFNDNREFGLVYVVGEAADGTGSATIAAALGSKLGSGASTKYRFTRGVIEAPRSASDSSLITAFASFQNTRVSVIAGGGKVISALTGRQHVVHVGRVLVAKVAAKAIGKDPSQVLAEPGTGSLPSRLLTLTRDEYKNPGLDSQRFVTTRTYVGLPGFYVTNWPLMSSVSSDFKYLQHGQVTDASCKLARNALLPWLSRDLPIKGDGTGQLTEPTYQAIDADADSAVRAGVVQPGHVTDIEVKGVRTDNVLSTETIRVKLSILPKTYAKRIELTVGFTRQITS